MTGQTLITPALLTTLGAANAAQNAPWLAQAADRWGIATAGRAAMWLANVLNESNRLTTAAENLTYSSAARLLAVFPSHFRSIAACGPYVANPRALGNLVYGSMGGYDFRGRGGGQITGPENYSRYALAVGKPLSQIGAWMASPEGAADSAAWYWHATGCSQYADGGDLLSVRDCWAGLRPHTAGPFGLAAVEGWFARVVSAMGRSAVPVASAQQTHAGMGLASGVVAHETGFGETQAGLSLNSAQQTTSDLNDASLAGQLGDFV